MIDVAINNKSRTIHAVYDFEREMRFGSASGVESVCGQYNAVSLNGIQRYERFTMDGATFVSEDVYADDDRSGSICGHCQRKLRR